MIEDEKLASALDRILRPSSPEGLKVLFDDWAKKSYWTVEEAVALMFSITPQVFQSVLDELLAGEGRPIVEVTDLVRRHFGEQLSPGDLPGWAKSIGLELPPDLVSAIHRRDPREKGPVRTEDETKITKTLLKILLGIAVGNHGFVPNRRNGATNAIWRIVTGVGLSVDEDTVRKYLQEAAAEYADELTEHFAA